MGWWISFLKLALLVASLKRGHCGREQQVLAPKYVVSRESVQLPCTLPAINDLLKWKFQANGSSIINEAAQYFPGGLTTIFAQFKLPPGRSTLIGGVLTITNVAVPDEGEYWCEVVQAGQPTLVSDKYPVVVWVTPRTPTIIPEGNGTVLEYTKTSVARCSSSGGKPKAQLSWWNGSEPLLTSAVPIVSKNSFSDKLWDVTLDLVLEHPTRFDHKRNFTCLVEHPAYKGSPKSLNHSVKVLYHPVNARIWANLTSLFVYCEAEGYKAPKYDWVIPGDLEYFDTPNLFMSDLYSLPGYEYFECTADNGVPPAAVVRIMVDDLRWPDGKPIPMLLGLAWYIWVAIGGGFLLVVIIVVVALCCYCKKKKKKGVGYNTKKTGGKAKYQPAVTSSAARHSQSSLLDSMRTPDGRESSLPPPSDYNPSKASMARSYSLEHLVDEKYPGQTRDSVMLVPLNHKQRDDLYNDSSLRRRASCEEIDKVADHIEVLNKSWDNLARSREDLNRSREQLRVELPPRYQSREDLNDQRPSYSRVDDRNAYPYMDDATNPHDDRYNGGYQGNQNNYQQGASGHNYDQRGSYDDRYNDQQQPYHDGNDQGYQQQYGDRDRNASYGDSEFDDDNGNYGDRNYNERNYDPRGYQPSSMI